MTSAGFWIFILLLVITAVPAFAHHSSLAQSTAARVTMQGTITRIEWVNPHVQIEIDVKDSVTGQVVHWRIETNSVTVLTTKGVTKKGLKVGASIAATGVERRGLTPRKLEVPEPDSTWKN